MSYVLLTLITIVMYVAMQWWVG